MQLGIFDHFPSELEQVDTAGNTGTERLYVGSNAVTNMVGAVIM